MKRNDVFQNLEMIGETIVALAAAAWITHYDWVAVVYCVGAVFTAVGRMGVTQKTDGNLALVRLFSMRRFALISLLLSSALMFVKGAHYLGYEVYIFPSSWLLFFAIFAVVEVYSTIRILHITK